MRISQRSREFDAPEFRRRIELEVRVKSVDAKMVVEGIDKIADRITASIVLAALIIGAALLMRVDTTSFRLFGYPGLAMVFFLAAGAGGFWLVISTFIHDQKGRKKSLH